MRAMFEGQSILGLSVSGLYFLVSLACLGAAFSGVSQRQPAAHVRVWVLSSLLFFAVLASRAFGIEDTLRQEFRFAMRVNEAYEFRREVQRPIASVVIMVFSSVAFLAVYRFARGGSGKRNLAVSFAGISALVMLGLVAVRVVSLHQIDEMLYGTLKLNWVTDFGASIAVLGSALYYVDLLRPRK